MKKKIVCVTGCRSEYDILYPVAKLLKKDKNFDVSLIVTGSHLSERFGYTVTEIENDGFRIEDRIHSLVDSDKKVGKIKSSAILMIGLGESLARLDPDFVMVVGDREEAIVAGVVCVYLGIPLIHLCGGDRTSPKEGDVDEPVRHATSKLASLHFTMNGAHKKRLLKMGEEPWRVFNVGDPAIDRFSEIKKMTKREVLKYFGFDPSGTNRPLVFVLQHVISGEAEKGGAQMKELLEAVVHPGINCIVNYPNSDMGSRGIIKVIDEYRGLPNVRVTRNIPRKEFVNMLRSIDLLVGNSSMALLEGAFLKIPSVNVGHRNKNRINGGNVIFVSTNSAAIRKVVRKALSDKIFRNKLRRCESVYGDGNSAKRIVRILKALDKTRTELTAKDITY
jgi:GDP/UDP-N,N'-diacetylbacillosamine 2-epimerase (hydrolysing)